MKKMLLFSACVMLAFASCSKTSSTKSTNTSSGTFSATVNGVNETFTTSLTASSVNSAPTYTIGVGGLRGTGTSSEGLQIVVGSLNGAVTTGTYTVDPSKAGQVYPPVVTYLKNATSTSPIAYVSNTSVANSTTIIITSISSTNVQGTFSGVLIDQSGNTSDTQTITDGKFNVNITK